MSIYKSIMAVQQELGTIGKDASNPFHKSKYATLEHVWDRVKPVLGKHGLAVIQPALTVNGLAGCRTIIIHVESGDKLESEILLPMPEKGLGAQAVGSCISYARRYSLTAALGLVVGDEDDDGEAADGRGQGGRKQAATPQNRPQAKATAKGPEVKSDTTPAPVEPPKTEPAAPTPKERKAAVIAYLKSDDSFNDKDMRDAISRELGRTVNPTGDVLLKSVVELEKLELWVEKLKALTSGKIGEWMRNNPDKTQKVTEN